MIGRAFPRLVPYTRAFFSDAEFWEARLALFLVALLLVPPCANIAILVYARTVTRQEEFAARYALGASRGRIVAQLFIEIFVLAAGAAGVALVLVRLAGVYMEAIVIGWPLWMDFSDFSVTTVFFVAALTVLAAVIAGVIPAIQATGRLAQSGLRALGGRTGMRLGATWTALVVAQVAFSVAVLPEAVESAWGTLRPGILGPGFAAEDFLTAGLAMDPQTGPGERTGIDPDPSTTRFGARRAELVRRLANEAGVSGVTVSAAVPGNEPWAFIEVSDLAGTPSPGGVLGGRSSLGLKSIRWTIGSLSCSTSRFSPDAGSTWRISIPGEPRSSSTARSPNRSRGMETHWAAGCATSEDRVDR